MRVEGLRFVREKELEGVVVFADDSNVHSMEFFNVIQRVNWVGVLPMGILGYAGFQDGKSKRKRRGSLLLGVVHKGQIPPKIDLQVQALAGDKTEGWHAHRPLPLDWDSGKGTPLLDDKLQWAGFVMNARAVWAPPPWLRDWEEWVRLEEGVYFDLRSIFEDESHVEELEGSGVVRHWWIRMEGRPNFKFLPRCDI
jgi:galactosylgalactosylxylosylprotein 3-beta-glucuronosyltransferase 2